MQKVNPINKLRFIWFDGEELGLWGSEYYMKNLSSKEKSHIAYNMDADVTATPNYTISIVNPSTASPSSNDNSISLMPNRIFAPSYVAENQLLDYFKSIGKNYVLTYSGGGASSGNYFGTDAFMFHLAGIPGSGIATSQECCKTQDEVNLFGGTVGNYEGNLGTSDGGCVDTPFRWCDNLSNNDPNVLEFISKGFASSVLQLSFTNNLGSSGGNAVFQPKLDITEQTGHRQVKSVVK